MGYTDVDWLAINTIRTLSVSSNSPPPLPQKFPHYSLCTYPAVIIIIIRNSQQLNHQRKMPKNYDRWQESEERTEY